MYKSWPHTQIHAHIHSDSTVCGAIGLECALAHWFGVEFGAVKCESSSTIPSFPGLALNTSVSSLSMFEWSGHLLYIPPECLTVCVQCSKLYLPSLPAQPCSGAQVIHESVNFSNNPATMIGCLSLFLPVCQLVQPICPSVTNLWTFQCTAPCTA